MISHHKASILKVIGLILQLITIVALTIIALLWIDVILFGQDSITNSSHSERIVQNHNSPAPQ